MVFQKHLFSDIVFAVTAGEKHGIGHLMRCLSLAEEAVNSNLKILFLLDGDKSALNILKNYNKNFQVVLWTSQQIKNLNTELIIFDTRRNINSILFEVKKKKIKILVIDRKDINHDLVDKVILQVVINNKKDNSKFLHDDKYIILSKIFTTQIPAIYPGKRKFLLITFGGSDPLNITEKVLKACNRISKNNNIPEFFFILGPANPEKIKLSKQIRKKGFKVIVSPNQIKLKKIMEESILAVAGFGISIYELISTGTPALWITHRRDDLAYCNALETKRLGWTMGYGSDILIKEIAFSILKYLDNTENLLRVHRTCKQFFRGQNGAKLLINECKKLLP